MILNITFGGDRKKRKIFEDFLAIFSEPLHDFDEILRFNGFQLHRRKRFRGTEVETLQFDKACHSYSLLGSSCHGSVTRVYMSVEDNKAHRLSQMNFLKKVLVLDYRGLSVQKRCFLDLGFTQWGQ